MALEIFGIDGAISVLRFAELDSPLQLHPNNWVPARPAGSQWAAHTELHEADEQRNRHTAGRNGTQ